MSLISKYLNIFVLFYCTYTYGIPGSDPNLQCQNSEQSIRKRRSATTISEPVACHLCGKIFFDKVDLVFHLETHLGKEPNSQHQNMEQSANKSRRVITDPDPIACSVCHKNFPDYVSLVFHFQSHFGKEFPNPMQHDLNSSPSIEKVGISHPNKIPRMADDSSPSNAPDLSIRDVSPVRGLVLNSWPPTRSSFDAQPRSPQLGGLHSTKSLKTATSSLSFPLFNSLFGLCTPDLNLAPEPSNKQNGGEMSVNTCNEIIVISDDEEDDRKSDVEKLDLTLKL